MTRSAAGKSRWRRLAPYWYVILIFWLVSLGLYAYHLATGITPGRVAFQISFLNFAIYWYGIIITGGIALGAYVTAKLALARAETLLAAQVPPAIRHRSVSDLPLPDEIQAILRRQKVITLGQLLLQWGFSPVYTGLNPAGQAELRHVLASQPGLKPAWLDDTPWRIWDPNHVWNGVIWCLILAVIGARLYHILTPSPSMAEVGINSPLDYFNHPLELLNFRRGGLGIYGGLAGGALGLWLYTRRSRIPMLAWADLAVVGLALGQAIGRWGNFLNQELYGRPTNVPWAVYIDPAYRLPDYADFSRFHPAFLYESLWNFMSFLVLHTLATRYAARLKTGDLMALYIILYAIGRTLLELVRLDSRLVSIGGVSLGLPVATLVSLVLAAIMAVWLVARHRRPTPAG